MRLQLQVTEPQIRLTTRPLEVHATTVPLEGRVIVRGRDPFSVTTDHPKSANTLSPSDKDRLESLEKQLAKLLEEVASLKRHEEKGK